MTPQYNNQRLNLTVVVCREEEGWCSWLWVQGSNYVDTT